MDDSCSFPYSEAQEALRGDQHLGEGFSFKVLGETSANKQF